MFAQIGTFALDRSARPNPQQYSCTLSKVTVFAKSATSPFSVSAFPVCWTSPLSVSLQVEAPSDVQYGQV